jgi:hypothetical protein
MPLAGSSRTDTEGGITGAKGAPGIFGDFQHLERHGGDGAEEIDELHLAGVAD